MKGRTEPKLKNNVSVQEIAGCWPRLHQKSENTSNVGQRCPPQAKEYVQALLTHHPITAYELGDESQ